MSQNAKDLCQIWNTILLNNSIEVCCEQLSGIGLIDIKLMKLCFLHPDFKMKEYLHALQIPNSTLTNIVNRLSKKGLISRTIDSKDYRSYCLTLSPLGVNAITKHLESEEQLMETFLSPLSGPEQEQFLKLLRKMTL